MNCTDKTRWAVCSEGRPVLYRTYEKAARRSCAELSELPELTDLTVKKIRLRDNGTGLLSYSQPERG